VYVKYVVPLVALPSRKSSLTGLRARDLWNGSSPFEKIPICIAALLALLSPERRNSSGSAGGRSSDERLALRGAETWSVWVSRMIERSWNCDPPLARPSKILIN
jgi:hypothetical protein